MKNIMAAILLTNVFTCQQPPKFHCDKKLDECLYECAAICGRTIKYDYEFGKCFARCTDPCRRKFCKEARMVELVDTEALKAFAIQAWGFKSLCEHYFKKEVKI